MSVSSSVLYQAKKQRGKKHTHNTQSTLIFFRVVLCCISQEYSHSQSQLSWVELLLLLLLVLSRRPAILSMVGWFLMDSFICLFAFFFLIHCIFFNSRGNFFSTLCVSLFKQNSFAAHDEKPRKTQKLRCFSLYSFACCWSLHSRMHKNQMNFVENFGVFFTKIRFLRWKITSFLPFLIKFSSIQMFFTGYLFFFFFWTLFSLSVMNFVYDGAMFVVWFINKFFYYFSFAFNLKLVQINCTQTIYTGNYLLRWILLVWNCVVAGVFILYNWKQCE